MIVKFTLGTSYVPTTEGRWRSPGGSPGRRAEGACTVYSRLSSGTAVSKRAILVPPSAVTRPGKNICYSFLNLIWAQSFVKCFYFPISLLSGCLPTWDSAESRNGGQAHARARFSSFTLAVSCSKVGAAPLPVIYGFQALSPAMADGRTNNTLWVQQPIIHPLPAGENTGPDDLSAQVN